MRHTGPYTVHIRFADHPRRPARTITIERKTFKAAENALCWHSYGVEAKWITNAAGIVYSPLAMGDPIAAGSAA